MKRERKQRKKETMKKKYGQDFAAGEFRDSKSIFKRKLKKKKKKSVF